mmetsp:Transcript_22006/g.43747  ORF Transcript_22006/g.43747 Transcript_22006/m.43747 type:complete len:96 (+) Transcript_22006:274-561(+)
MPTYAPGAVFISSRKDRIVALSERDRDRARSVVAGMVPFEGEGVSKCRGGVLPLSVHDATEKDATRTNFEPFGLSSSFWAFIGAELVMQALGDGS